jgi:cytochrome c-type biogenesis protein CcmH
MRWLARLALLLVIVAGAAPSFAVQPDEIMSNPAQEARARALSRELRCMVCQNESIDDSAAPLARDLRLLVRERIAAGDTDAQVLDFLVARYGEFVLLKPRLEVQTLALWLLPPFVLLLGGSAMALATLRRRRASGALGGTDISVVPLSAEEDAKLATLVGEPPR